MVMKVTKSVVVAVVFILSACASSHPDVWHDPEMDFGAVKTVAVMPFANLSQEQTAGANVRDVFMNRLLATGAVYVLPLGEVARGIARAGIADPTAPSPEEVVKLCGIIKADAVITGVVLEYGNVRSGSAIGYVIALTLSMLEGQAGRTVWTGSTREGGISFKDRLLGPSGKPMNVMTSKAVDDAINLLFQ
jgi:hypothetical protein